MIDQSEIYNLSFEDFIEIDENLKYSEEELGVRCFVEAFLKLAINTSITD